MNRTEKLLDLTLENEFVYLIDILVVVCGSIRFCRVFFAVI
ncbi:hypothetical protein NIES2104_35260 [Leptolyngbya sp. NIES-2104]|nr:hypothetical protein NIES2104_35260 [Leptolyngbya sp. NIES-2104]